MKNRSILLYTSLVFISFVFMFSACSNSTGGGEEIIGDHSAQTTQESDIITETNSVRTDPTAYAAMLEAELPTITNPATRDEYNTAINALKGTLARSPLSFEQGLFFAARDHAADMVMNNFFNHPGSNGSTVDKRISRYGTWSVSCGENIAAGRPTAANVVKAWVLSTGHRNNILNSSFTKIGVAHISGHPTYNWVSVQVFTGGYVSN